MGRVLSESETAAFRARHPSVDSEIRTVEAGGAVARSSALAYPRHGRAVLDRPGPTQERYVLVWRDASRRWWFVDLSGMRQLPHTINKPEFVSPNASLLQNIIDQTGLMFDAGAKAFQGLVALAPWVVALLALSMIGSYLPRRR